MAKNLELRKSDITEIKDDKVVVLIGKEILENHFYVEISFITTLVFQLDKLSLELRSKSIL